VFQAFDNLSLNSSGQVAFSATLLGEGVTEANNKGIWAQTLGGTLKLIVREGQTIEVAAGSMRTVASLAMVHRRLQRRVRFGCRQIIAW
jgi:hypothetical protein